MLKRLTAFAFIGFVLCIAIHLALPANAANIDSQKFLKSISSCLPIAEMGPPYQYSVAEFATDVNRSRWVLIRAHTTTFTAPSYSIILLKDKTCINFNKLPTLDISRTAKVPASVLSKFSSVMRLDQGIAWSKYQNHIRQQYPGKSVQELKQMGIFGMDNL